MAIISHSDQQRLLEELRRCSFSILYTPMPDEENPDSLPLPLKDVLIIRVPRDKNTSPVKFAQELLSTHQNERGCLLIPGTRFDWHGTRYGRGGGWYDRLLAHLPRTYLRIGITKREQISDKMLKRNPWDEPMDWLIYRENDVWNIKQTPQG